VSDDYKDLVMKILVQDPSERLPLVKVFVHPWVLNFQQKYKIIRERDESSEEETSSADEEEEDSDENDEDVESEEEISDGEEEKEADLPVSQGY
jgi:hypothetical protein